MLNVSMPQSIKIRTDRKCSREIPHTTESSSHKVGKCCQNMSEETMTTAGKKGQKDERIKRGKIGKEVLPGS